MDIVLMFVVLVVCVNGRNDKDNYPNAG